MNDRLILDNINMELFVIDKSYHIVDFNKSFASKVEASSKSIIGKSCYNVSHKSDIPCWQMKGVVCPAKKAFETNERSSTIHKHFFDDKVVVEEVVCTPIENGQYVIEEIRNLSSLLGLTQGALPICARCKKIRDSQGKWCEIEGYFNKKTGSDFSHTICPDCTKELYKDLLKTPPV